MGATEGWADEVHIYRSTLSRPSQRWRWRRMAGNGKTLSQSSEGYGDQGECADMAARCNPGVVIHWPTQTLQGVTRCR